MSNQKHTPGPWITSQHGEIRPARKDQKDRKEKGWSFGYAPIAKTVGDKRTTTPAINEANARLIASAPDLLASLEEVTAKLSQIHNHYHPACEGGCPTVEYIMNARKAILKANGG